MVAFIVDIPEEQHSGFWNRLIFEMGAKKFCPYRLIKKERIVKLIYGKPRKNRYKLINKENNTT
jgi:hypothetical protein